jgi:hypothetical protein
MATAQPDKSSRASGDRSARGSSPRGGEEIEKDKNYNLIAVLHRSLQNAERCAQYCEDAEDAGDDELVEFFEDTYDEHKQRADRARQLLAARLGEQQMEIGDDADDADEEEDEEP